MQQLFHDVNLAKKSTHPVAKALNIQHLKKVQIYFRKEIEMKALFAIVASLFALSAVAQTAPAKKEEAKPAAAAPAKKDEKKAEAPKAEAKKDEKKDAKK